jgi:D-sedoheptulose 7-phosphate isomerase
MCCGAIVGANYSRKDVIMLGATLDCSAYLQRLQQEVERLDRAALMRWSEHLYAAWRDGRFVYVFGNGGSGTTATHITEDLGKSTLDPRDLQDESKRRLKIMSLTDNCGWILAVGNDVGYEDIFVQQLMNYGQPGDLCVAISGSGNSPNIIKAVEWAKRHGLTTFGLTGFRGGRLKSLQDDGLHVELDDMGMVESIHLAAFHWVLNDVYARINHVGRYGGNSHDDSRN